MRCTRCHAVMSDRPFTCCPWCNDAPHPFDADGAEVVEALDVQPQWLAVVWSEVTS